jgi:hypothetical protein
MLIAASYARLNHKNSGMTETEIEGLQLPRVHCCLAVSITLSTIAMKQMPDDCCMMECYAIELDAQRGEQVLDLRRFTYTLHRVLIA